MATAHSTPSLDSEDRSKFQLIKDSIYDSCVAGGPETRLYTQRDILDFGIIPHNSGETLMKVIQALTAERLLIVVSLPGGNLAWKWRSAEDAARYRNLTQEQSMVYAMVDEAGADGIWSRTVKARLGMHDSVLKQALKFLESKGYIKDMKSVEHPNKKMYIKAGLRPSDRATGGPWYTDSDLDEAFIAELTKFIFDYITRQSTYKSVHREHKEKQPKKGVLKGEKTEAKGRKRTAEEISTDEAKSHHASKKEPKKTMLLPLPAGYNDYPTVRQIAELISSSGITSNTTLSEGDVQQLVDVLVWDNLVEPIKVGKRLGYRTVKAAKVDPVPLTQFLRDNAEEDEFDLPREMGAEPSQNGLTEAPCGRCPVFDLCEEGGPVSPSNCVYFQRWLGLE